jgi:peptidylprolyl isomerase
VPRRLLLLLLVPLLALGACGDDEDPVDTSGSTETTGSGGGDGPSDELETAPADQEALDAVGVTEGADGAAPTLEFEQPFEVGTTARRILTEGEGEAAADGSTVEFDFVFVNGRDGSEVSSSYGLEPAVVSLDDRLLPGVRLGLLGLQSGSEALLAIAPADAFEGQGDDEASGVRETDTLLMHLVVQSIRTPLERAEGTAVDPVDGLPEVELDDDGAPTITVPGGEPPAELVVQPLIEGDGAEVESGQDITVHYTGVLWDGGEQFDSSWEGGSPATFNIGTGAVIPGWDKGLVGQKVGSQVLLVIPPADGYGDAGQGSIPAGATLVFVVDILDAG